MVFFGLILLISLISVTYFFIAMSGRSHGGCSQYLRTPISFNVEGLSFNIAPVSENSRNPDVYVFSKEPVETISGKCAINTFRFFPGEGYNALGEKRGVLSWGQYSLEGNTRSKSNAEYTYNIDEPKNKRGNLREAFNYGKSDFYLLSVLEPFVVSKEFRDKENGCFYARGMNLGKELKINLKDFNKNAIEVSSEEVICLKDTRDKSFGITSNQDCTYFIATSRMKITYEVLGNMIFEDEMCRPI